MRLVAFDTETTGTDPYQDRIVELCLMPAGAPAEVFRVNPGVPIPEGASAVHGIRDADVADAPPFSALAAKVQALVEDAVLLGYNSRSFDTVLLDQELKRAGEKGLDLARTREIDVYQVWNAVEPRTLEGAAKRWCGRAHGDAHDARGDVEMTLAVWHAMREKLGLSDADGEAFTRPENEVDRAGKFLRDDAGHVVFAFGKHAGRRVKDVDPAYLRWMMQNDFPASTKAVVARLLESGAR